MAGIGRDSVPLDYFVLCSMSKRKHNGYLNMARHSQIQLNCICKVLVDLNLKPLSQNFTSWESIVLIAFLKFIELQMKDFKLEKLDCH